MDPRELDLLVAGASTHRWVGQSGNSDCCVGVPTVQMMIMGRRLTDEEGQLLIEELQRPLTEEEQKARKPLLDSRLVKSKKERPELVAPLISLLLRIYLDAKARGEEQTARKVIEGLDFLGILDRPS